jgi:hypothetical protein
MTTQFLWLLLLFPVLGTTCWTQFGSKQAWKSTRSYGHRGAIAWSPNRHRHPDDKDRMERVRAK